MEHISVKTRVAIWYAALFIVIIAAVYMIMAIVANRTVIKDTKDILIASVNQAVNSIDLTSGDVYIDPSMDYNFYGSQIVIYNDKGMAISGLIPDDYPAGIEFTDEVFQEAEGEKDYYVYDRLIENPVTGDIWVRGVISAELSDMAPEFASIIRFALILFPVLFIIAIFGGLMITNRAFTPLKQMIDTAQKISSSGDISARIPLGDEKSKDEMVRAAGVFNNMLDEVQTAFENEKKFTDDASHELRTPTAVIMSQSEYALENTDDADEMISSLNTIHQESKKMDSLVSQLLMLARADHGRIVLDKERTDISLLAEESCERIRRFADEKGITISAVCDEGVYIDADSALFSRIYDNLLTNSIKYGRENGNIWVIVNEDSGHPVITIRDDGTGIDEKDLSHIFERFYREENNARVEGLGLGLPIVKWIVEAHGGTISCTSTKGIGTRFIIEF